MTRQKLFACLQCDLLQQEVHLVPHSDAHCSRCGALLYRGSRTRRDVMLALVLGSTFLFIVSNLFPIAVLETHGIRNSTTLFGTVLALYHQGRPLVAAPVLLTTMLIPAMELGALLYMLLPLRFSRIIPGMDIAFRLVLAIHPWSMMEVFMLGVLVTLIKLSDVAAIIPGIALWAFASFIGLFTVVAASFSVHDFWNWMDSLRAGMPERRR